MSQERVDFGEAKDKKYFVMANVEKGKTSYEWREIKGIRTFIDRFLKIENNENVTEQLRSALPTSREMAGAIVRLVLEYPRDWESLIDEAALREIAAEAFEFHLVKRPKMETRIRIPEDKNVGSLSMEELLEIYWKSAHNEPVDTDSLMALAKEIIQQVESGEET